MVLWFALGTLGLLLVNSLLIFFFRGSTSFSHLPGLVMVVLGISLGSYLFYLLYSVQVVSAPLGKNGSGPANKTVTSQRTPSWQGKATPETFQEKEVRLRLEENESREKRREAVGTISLFVGILIVQAMLGILAAIIGKRIVKPKKEHYNRYLILNSFLALLFIYAELFLSRF